MIQPDWMKHAPAWVREGRELNETEWLAGPHLIYMVSFLLHRYLDRPGEDTVGDLPFDRDLAPEQSRRARPGHLGTPGIAFSLDQADCREISQERDHLADQALGLLELAGPQKDFHKRMHHVTVGIQRAEPLFTELKRAIAKSCG